MADILKQTALLDALTPKQREVIALASEGMTSKEIARKLGISESAVNQRIEVIRQRLGGMSRAQIARLYRQTSTLVFTIPTSNSLTGESLQLQDLAELGQTSTTEGAGKLAALEAGPPTGRLQPSIFFHLEHGPNRAWYRLAIIMLALALAATLVLILASVEAIDRLAS